MAFGNHSETLPVITLLCHEEMRDKTANPPLPAVDKHKIDAPSPFLLTPYSFFF